jgi:hypothetical protein
LTTTPGAGEIVVFDLLSHEAMHHAFNEAYIRTLRAAYPASAITVHAAAGQVRHLAPRVADLAGVTLLACPTFAVPFGFSRHNPLAGGWAASRSLAVVQERLPRTPRLVAVLGVDSNLYGALARRWPRLSPAPLHMILHSHLGDAMLWRSRNPLIRSWDFMARLGRPLPPSVRLVVLELGIKEAIAEIAPHLAPNVVTLEHPILESEWASGAAPPRADGLAVAFLGHARQAKGYPAFLELASACARPDLDFQAIGLASPDTAALDASALSLKPSPRPLERAEYLARLAAADLVCVPFQSRAYEFTASGTVGDAIAAVKPLLALRNRTLAAIAVKYGPIGWLAESREDLFRLMRGIDRGRFAALSPQWLDNLARIREARRPASLAPSYARLIAADAGR